MIAQMISPQTTAPTAQAAIQEPLPHGQRDLALLGDRDRPASRVKALDVHPAVPPTTATRTRRERQHAAATGGTRPRCGEAAAVWPGARPGTCAPRLCGALGVGLTGCLPSG